MSFGDMFGGVLDGFQGFATDAGSFFDRADTLNSAPLDLDTENAITMAELGGTASSAAEGGGFLGSIFSSENMAKAGSAALKAYGGGSRSNAASQGADISLSDGMVPLSAVARSAAGQSQPAYSVDPYDFYARWTKLARLHSGLGD